MWGDFFDVFYLNYIRCFKFSIKTSDIDLASGYISFRGLGSFPGGKLWISSNEIIIEYFWGDFFKITSVKSKASWRGSGIPKIILAQMRHTLWSYSKMIFLEENVLALQ